MSKAVYKVSGGKLVKVELEHSKGKIVRVKITGDFFVHPEDALVELERCLEGVSLQESEIVKALEKKISQVNCQLIGFSAADIAKAISMAMESEKE